MKRKVDLVIISDVHLGTYGCHALELLNYLNSIQPRILVLNGDIIDIWQFRKRYWPKSHMKVVKRLIDLASKKTTVYYISGNHDELLRKFTPLSLGKLHFKNKLVLNIENKKLWIFHGDIFDFTMKRTKWLAKLGGIGYDFLIVLNRFLNQILFKLGKERVSFSRKIKNSVKKAVRFISDFESTIAEIAIENGYEMVACGHIHQAVIKEIKIKDSKVVYLNSGDWVESLTAVEYHEGNWRIFNYHEDFIDNASLNFEEIDELDFRLINELIK
ncbi:MAG: UDP-2,3-diacylglucosamine diphosphatase [Flavobacteriales bacterium]